MLCYHPFNARDLDPVGTWGPLCLVPSVCLLSKSFYTALRMGEPPWFNSMKDNTAFEKRRIDVTAELKLTLCVTGRIPVS